MHDARHVKLKSIIGLMGFTWVTVKETVGSNVFAANNVGNTVPGFGSPWPYLFNLAFALVIVIILVIILIRFLAKRANVQQRGSISVLAARQLAPNRSVQVVEVRGRRYLLGVADEITLIADVTDSFNTDTGFESRIDDGTQFRQVLAERLASLRKSYRAGESEEDHE